MNTVRADKRSLMLHGGLQLPDFSPPSAWGKYKSTTSEGNISTLRYTTDMGKMFSQASDSVIWHPLLDLSVCAVHGNLHLWTALNKRSVAGNLDIQYGEIYITSQLQNLSESWSTIKHRLLKTICLVSVLWERMMLIRESGANTCQATKQSPERLATPTSCRHDDSLSSLSSVKQNARTLILLGLKDVLPLSLSAPSSSVFFGWGPPNLKQDSLSMSDPVISILKVLSLACSWRTRDKVVWGAWAGWGRSWEGGEGQLTVGPGVPFRLLVTACPVRNVFFKTRLSSAAGHYNNKRTSSAVWEDANAATLDRSRGQ